MIVENTPSSTPLFIPSFAPAFNPQRVLPFRPAASAKSAWQHAVLQSDLPSTVKFVLLTLSVEWMDAAGGSCFPTLEQIAKKAGLSRQAVARALDQAVEAGYLHRWHWGHGKGNRRWNYQATLPRGQMVTEDNNHRGVLVIENDHKPCPSLTLPKERAATPEPASPQPATVEPITAPLSVPKVRIQSRTGLPEDWTLPEDWLDAAQQERPDLSPEAIQASAKNFRDYHLSRGTQTANWKYEWTRWIRRERRTQLIPQPSTPTNPPWGSPTPTPPPTLTPEERTAREQAVQQRMEAANRQAEERRIQMLIANGIDPKTGQRVAPPKPTLSQPQTPQGENRTLTVPVEKKPGIAPPMTRAQQIAVLELRQAGIEREEAVAAVLNDPRFHRGQGH